MTQQSIRPNVLVVEDERDLAQEIHDVLLRYAMDPVTVHDWDATLAAAREHKPALVLLDRYLDGLDTVALLPELRRLTAAPIIFLSGSREEVDRIVALEVGADDFLTKPLSPRELVARIRAHIRRQAIQKRARPGLPGVWNFDLTTRRLIRPSGEEVALTSAEFAFLAALIEVPGTPLDRDMLSEKVFQRRWRPDDRSLDNLVTRLRRKFGPGGDRTIATIRGQGYAFTTFPGEDGVTAEE